MANKRSKRKNIRHFFCPFCEIRLWRLNSSKHHLCYRKASEIRQNLQISPKKANFLSSQNSAYLDRNSWLEEFFCPKDGKMWLRLTKHSEGEIVYRLAKEEDWQQTNKTVDPIRPNPSVSEFTYRMSRRGYYRN
jgi:hypothetical protein